LNSSKITVSIAEPVSTSAVAKIGQRAAVLDVAGRAEEALRRVQRRRVDAAGEDAPAGRSAEVVGAARGG
jgi:hypothetical protein